MNFLSVGIVLAGLILNSSILLSETHQQNPKQKERAVQSQTISTASAYFKGRWTDKNFEYLDEKNNYVEAKAAFRATKDGTFLDINGNTVEYTKGDIVFKAQDDGWYKARKEAPSIEPPPAPEDPAVPNPEKIDLSETERLVIKFTNEERMKRGLPALKVAPQLLKLSRQKSTNMARSQNLSHGVSPRPNGGENIAWNQANAREVVRTWMNSDGHRANILSRRYSTIGVGMAVGNGPYWTQMFQ